MKRTPMAHRFAAGAVLAMVLGLVGLAAGAGAPAQAHPHVWIDMRSQPLFTEDGLVAGVEIEWTFDELYTAFALDGLPTGKDGKVGQRALKKLADGNVSNLKDYSYFTFVEINGEAAPYADARATWTDTLPSEFGPRLAMRFELALEAPVDPAAAQVTYAVYDPSYYIQILHWEGERALLGASAPEACTIQTVAPQPTQEMFNLAMIAEFLPPNEQSIGRGFAEHVTLECGFNGGLSDDLPEVTGWDTSQSSVDNLPPVQ